MLSTILAIALYGAAYAADHDAAVASDELAVGATVAPEFVQRDAQGQSRSPSGARPSSGGPRPSGARPSGGSRPSGAKPASGPRPSSGARPAPKPSGSSGAPSGARPAPRPSGSAPAGARPATTGPRPSGAAPAGARPANRPMQRPAGTLAASRPGVANPQHAVPGRSVARPQLGQRPTGALRNPTTSRPVGTPPHRSGDVRYSRPAYHSVRAYPHARYTVPRVYTYRPYYSRWWCHPYYRYTYATVAVVGFGFHVAAWNAGWAPPYRYGWTWSPGYWSWGYWHPGFWVPAYSAPVGYMYVNGWWENDAYVEGYYRKEARNGWDWVEGYYLEDGTYVRGHWMPTEPGPEGYVWEPGFWDGETATDGFWRPQFRQGYYWVGAWYDNDGVFHGGYWMPEVEEAGKVWVPGWFDGNEWTDGYWEDEETYRNTDLESWKPEEGVDDGWNEPLVDEAGPNDGSPPAARVVERRTVLEGSEPLAVPVVIPSEE